MVTTTETTNIVTQPKTEHLAQPSFQRWLKHFLFMPATKRYFNQQDQQAITNAVEQAEHGHVGEIQVVIEGHIPCSQAYRQDVKLRARELFAELGVWDTEFNSGVLLYINLCEKSVEIVIDRGIKHGTQQELWDKICQQLLNQMREQQYRDAVVEAVLAIGEVLNQFYDQKTVDRGDELGNAPILLG